jgi:DNA-binding response OmpR family regulator
MVLDLMMPDMDGFQLLEKMKTENLAQSTVKIVLSNLGSETDVKLCSEIGVDGYIIKANSTPDEVVEQVAASLFEKTNS